MLEIDSFVGCFINDRTFSTTCQDYMATVSTGDPGCDRDVTFRYDVDHVGFTCGVIDRVEASVFFQNDITQIINTDVEGWSNEKQNFCPGESFIIDQQVVSMNLCELANEEIDYKLKVITGERELEGVGIIQFPGADNGGTAPPSPPATQAPTVTPGNE